MSEILKKPAHDPRADGFNYGAPLPVSATAKPYHDAVALSDRLRDIAHQASQRAWRLDMATRAYRIACNPIERLNAQVQLETIYSELYRFSPVDGGAADTGQYSFADLETLGKSPTGRRQTVPQCAHIWDGKDEGHCIKCGDAWDRPSIAGADYGEIEKRVLSSCVTEGTYKFEQGHERPDLTNVDLDDGGIHRIT